MRYLQALSCLWPGLPRLWRHGSLSALLLALGFAVLLNSVVLLTFVPPGWAPAWLRTGLWWILVIGWGAAQRLQTDRAQQQLKLIDTPAAVVGDQGLFLQAQAEYLRGHWFEAESHLQQLLGAMPHDADARLLLVSLLRRSGRADEARRELRELAATAGATKWSLEIEREQALLDRRDEISDADGEVETKYLPARDDDQRLGGGPTARAA